MSQKLAFDTLITALTCLMPSLDSNKYPINLAQHKTFVLEDPNLFCKVERNLEQRITELALQKEQNDRDLLWLEYESIKMNEKLSLNETNENFPKDCRNLKYGVHKFKISDNLEPFYTLCDNNTRSGDWLLILQRTRNSKTVKHNLLDIKNGYGLVYDDFFIGIKNIQDMLKNQQQELLILLKDEKFETNFAHYNKFSIKSSKDNYEMILGNCRGPACDMEQRNDEGNAIFDMECENEKLWWVFNCVRNTHIQLFLRPKLKRADAKD